MRSICYIPILLLLLSVPAISQINVNSLWRLGCADSIVTIEALQAPDFSCPEELQEAGTAPSFQQAQNTSHSVSLLQASIGNRPVMMEMGWLWLWTLLALLMATGGGFLFKRYKQLLHKQQELSAAVEGLKEKLLSQLPTAASSDKSVPQLDRELVESAIDARLGESAWRIMNLIVDNPAITNKEIATEVSLSMDGVSSSLRRMYAAFNVRGSGNKKIILARRVMKIVADSESEAAK